MNPHAPVAIVTGQVTVPVPATFFTTALTHSTLAGMGPVRLAGAIVIVPVGTVPFAAVTVATTSYMVPGCSLAHTVLAGLVMFVVVTTAVGGGVVDLFVTLMTAVPDDGLCRALPEYLAVIVLVPGLVNCAEHDVVRRYRLPWHSLRVPSQNVTVPVGFPPVPFSVAAVSLYR